MRLATAQPDRKRRTLLLGSFALGASSLVLAAGKQPIAVQVWKGPSCECCKDWVLHLEKSGFVVNALDQGNSVARARLGMPLTFGSCHTALVQGYVLEGHVPAVHLTLAQGTTQGPGAGGTEHAPRVTRDGWPRLRGTPPSLSSAAGPERRLGTSFQLVLVKKP